MTFLQNNNIYSKRMPSVIIVSVSHFPGAEAMTLRTRDFTPTRTAAEANSGGAATFLDFFEHELIPMVDHTYRTIPLDRGVLAIPMEAYLRSTVWSSGLTVQANRRREPGFGLG